MTSDEMDRLTDRVWSRVHSLEDPVQDPIIMAADGHLLTYGRTLATDFIDDCLDDD